MRNDILFWLALMSSLFMGSACLRNEGSANTAVSNESKVSVLAERLMAHASSSNSWQLSDFIAGRWDNVVIFNAPWHHREAADFLGGVTGAKKRFGSSKEDKEVLIVVRFGEDIQAVEKVKLPFSLLLKKNMLTKKEATFVLDESRPLRTFVHAAE
jgi:hypothetical protein